MDAGIWDGVDRLIDRADGLAGPRAHGLHLLAARRFRATGRPVPEELAAEERAGAILALVAPLVLDQVRAAYDGPLILIKGLEVASLYPDPVLRPFGDVDLLALDPDGAQRALVEAGFEPVGNVDDYYSGRHHLRPLRWPGLPISVEIHRRPEWPNWSSAPSSDEFFSMVVPSAVGTDGLLALQPGAHALVLTAHSWSGSPLRRLLDLIDILVLTAGTDREEMRTLARSWGLLGVWETTLAAAEALVYDRALPWSLRLWARDLARVRDRTVLENHIRPLAGAFWALPPHRALRVAARALAGEFRPGPDESWSTMLGRARSAARNAFKDLNEHHQSLAPAKGGPPRQEGRDSVGADPPSHGRAEMARDRA